MKDARSLSEVMTLDLSVILIFGNYLSQVTSEGTHASEWIYPKFGKLTFNELYASMNRWFDKLPVDQSVQGKVPP